MELGGAAEDRHLLLVVLARELAVAADDRGLRVGRCVRGRRRATRSDRVAARSPGSARLPRLHDAHGRFGTDELAHAGAPRLCQLPGG
eukprot:7208835-Pyramimonas_sp.AAC.1